MKDMIKVLKMGKSDTRYENELKELLENTGHGHVVIRSAGSMGDADLVAIDKWTKTAVIIEVKSKKAKVEKAYYVSRYEDAKAQYADLCKHAATDIKTYYAVRWKDAPELRGKPLDAKWEIFGVKRLMIAFKTWPVLQMGNGNTIDEVFGVK